jgi:hypothetical protein
MFHVGGTSSTYAALIRAGSIYLVDGFSTGKFWDQVRTGQCVTTCGLIGVMAAFLAKAEPRTDDGDNPLRCLTMFPIEPFTVHFAQRFGFDYVTGFNMTEVSAPLITDLNTRAFGSCGRPRSGVQVRLVDDHDIEVPRGTIGQMIVRSDAPWTMNAGYNGQPEATAAAWRNGWFHTGDLFRQDEDGNFFFVDRIKDTIRRRGENISSFEVENAVAQFPDVDEVVAIGVASEIAEQEVMVVVKLETRPRGRPEGADRVPAAATRLLHGAALRARGRRDPQDRDQQDPQGGVPRPGRHPRHLGPRAGGNHAAPRQIGRLTSPSTAQLGQSITQQVRPREPHAHRDRAHARQAAERVAAVHVVHQRRGVRCASGSTGGIEAVGHRHHPGAHVAGRMRHRAHRARGRFDDHLPSLRTRRAVGHPRDSGRPGCRAAAGAARAMHGRPSCRSRVRAD